jgi:hypothetical protein
MLIRYETLFICSSDPTLGSIGLAKKRLLSRPSPLPPSLFVAAQIRYLAKIAHDQLVLDGKTPKGGKPWVWEEGSETHTWPGGKAYWVVGKRAD